MSEHSPSLVDSEPDFDSDSMDYGSQAFVFDDNDVRTNPKWAAYFIDDDEIDLKPKISLMERIRLVEEKEKELLRKARERGPMKIPDHYVSEIPVKPCPEKEEQLKMERYKAWCEKLKRIKREKEEWQEARRKLARAEYEKHCKLQKEYRTRDYYWKPDPLYALHLKEKGYSKIAIDKALFYTDNRSVARALEYLKKNPNPTELTKEEVMAAGEEVLKRIRPVKPKSPEQTKEGEMEIEQASQPFSDGECSTGLMSSNESLEEIREGPKEAPKEVSVNDCMKSISKSEDSLRRGIKRSHDGEEVKLCRTTSVPVEFPPLFLKEPIPEYKIIFLINTILLMDAITLSLEVGKVVANLTNKMRTGTVEFKTMFDDWIRDGNKMSMYKGNDSKHLNSVHNSIDNNISILSYLGQCSHYRNVKTPSPTVLGIFGDSALLKRLYMNWEML